MDILSAALLLFFVMDPFGNVPFFLTALRNVEPSGALSQCPGPDRERETDGDAADRAVDSDADDRHRGVRRIIELRHFPDHRF